MRICESVQYIINCAASISFSEPLEKAAREGQLFAYKHDGFWQCMDTKRDKDNLEEIYSKSAPWL